MSQTTDVLGGSAFLSQSGEQFSDGARLPDDQVAVLGIATFGVDEPIRDILRDACLKAPTQAFPSPSSTAWKSPQAEWRRAKLSARKVSSSPKARRKKRSNGHTFIGPGDRPKCQHVGERARENAVAISVGPACFR